MVAIFALPKQGFAQGPVISSVNINSCVGEIRISVTSGVLPYTFAWEDSGGNPVGGNSFLITGLAADDYRVTVTDGNSDSITAIYTVTNPPDLVGSVVVNDVTCRGDSDAQVVVTMANGNPDYAWVLTNSGGGTVGTGTVGGIVITIGGLGVDSYSLEVTDADGCIGTITFVITEPAQFLDANLVSITDATCSDLANGSLEVVGTGGWGGYTYAWYTEPGGAFLSNGASIAGLLPGDYRVYVTDANGCVVTQVYTIDSPEAIATTSTLTAVSCNSGNNGAIDISVTGGNGGYSYVWSNGPTTEDISGLTAGNYSVTITDNLACTYTESFTITEPNALAINPTITDVLCFGDNTGRVRTNPTGGTAPYTYSWSTGNTGKNLNNRVAGTYSVTVTDANGCTAFGTYTVNEPAAMLSELSITNNSPSCFGGNDGSLTLAMQGGTAPYAFNWSNGSTTNTATGLAAGIYNVTVTDNNSCTFSTSYTVTDPLKIAVVTTTTTEPSCNGAADGSITVTASNGTGPYNYDWNTGDNGSTLSNIPAGTYTVTVTDNGGCVVSEDFTLGEPALIEPNAVVNNISCNGETDGSIFLATSGGTGGYTYLWNTGATANNISGLSAGSYSVTITDNTTCSVSESFTIIEPDPLQVAIVTQDILCKGQSTGSIDLTPSDGTAPYSFLWSNGATSEDLVNVPAGTYDVTITDTPGCSISRTITITEPATILELNGTATDVTCNGAANGSIDFSVTGGATPYVYLWNTGATSQDLTNIGPGVYNVQVTDGNGCIKFESFTITQPAALSVNPTKTDITCNGEDDGTVILNISGGTAPYAYLWNDGSTDQNRTDLIAGNYTVTVTDDKGCTNIQNITINEPAILSATSAKQDVLCFGDASGTINITSSGGTTPYSFLWSNGEITEDLTGLIAGNYSVTITDARGCTFADSYVITEPASALSFTPTVGQITCNGAADGAISLNVIGGVSPYTYNWSNGSTIQNLSGLAPGNYSVIIKDANNCQVTGSYLITDPPILSVSGTSTDISCFGANDGTVDITVAGGEAPFTYVWSTGDNIEDVTGLAPGTHTVQVIDNRGCSVSKSFTLTQPTALNISYTSVDVDCFGGNDGSIDLTVTGGTAPYSYSWDSGQAQPDITDLTAQVYTVTITDGNGCTEVESITINEPVAALDATFTVTDLSCFGSNNGSVELVVSGGTAPYTYTWSNGKTTRDVFGLIPGNYSVIIEDAHNCTVSKSFTITMPDALQLTASTTNLSCNGTMNGAIDLTITGGTAPYTFGWGDGATTEDRTNISGGTYQVFITDANGCSLNKTYVITEPLAIVATINKTDVSCFGEGDGSIDISVSGGVAPYTYSWNNGAITQDLLNISGGTYELTITDANNCQIVETVVVDEPTSALTVSGVKTDVTCFGGNDGAIDLTVSGGTAPYTFSWNQGSNSEDVGGLTAGNYQVVVTDARGCIVPVSFTIGTPTQIQASVAISNVSCNGEDDGAINITVSGGTGAYTYLWSNGATSEDLSALAPGNYSVQITDANNCVISKSYSVTEPAAMTIGFTKTDVLCFGESSGAIDITVAGGVGGYTYSWSNGAIFQDIAGLVAGVYQVTVTDVNGCAVTQSITITEPAAALAATETTSNLSCYDADDGAVDITVSGGTAPYTYNWGGGVTTEDRVNLPEGTYQVIITDNNGCAITKNYTITAPDELILTSSKTDLTCNGSADGAIDITIKGGTLPYTYAWSNGETTEDVSGLAAGNYSVLVTDANSCTVTESFTITEPAVLALSYTQVDVLCFGENTGSIDLIITGGTSPYTYAWDNGEIIEDISTLIAGIYNVTVTDANGCTDTESITITEPASALAVTETTANLSCFNADDGTIDITVSGGTAPYTFDWGSGVTTEDRVNLPEGTYQVIITDNNGCDITKNYTITAPDELILTSSKTDLTCNGSADGALDITITGGTLPYTYAWSNGETIEDISGLIAGNYSVLVTDANSCTVNGSFTITEPAILAIIYSQTNVLCFGESTGAIDITITGGTAPYTYAWSNTATSQDINTLAAGTYDVVVTDVNGCSETESITITEPAAALALTETTANLSCFNANDGAIDISATGGTAPYTYDWGNGNVLEDRSNLPAGNYSVTVSDANGCTITKSYTITTPSALNVSVSVQNVTCNAANDGAIDLTVTGGTAPYTFAWSDGVTTEDRPSISGGTYNVAITDANGCFVSRSYVVVEPLALSATFVKTDVTCFGQGDGAIDITVTGGTAPYTYSWLHGATTQDLANISGGTYELEITDANSCQITKTVVIDEPISALSASGITTDVSCFGGSDGRVDLTVTGGTAPYTYNWNNGISNQDASGLSAGNYQVVVTDVRGCTLTLPFTIGSPTKLEATASVSNVTCNGANNGEIDFTVTGGTGAYTYLWSNGATTEDLSGLAPGNYTVQVTDANNCTISKAYQITEPIAMGLAFTKTDVLCFGESTGAIDITVSGGVGGYTYSWSNGATSQDISGLIAGTYDVTVTDVNGCFINQSVTITEPTAALAVTETTANLSCFNADDGAIDISVTGGTAPYAYDWSNGVTTQDLVNLPEGTYEVEVTDANSCKIFRSYTITTPDELILTSSTTNLSCKGAADGTIDINITGGTLPYIYAWSNGAAIEDLSGLAAGNYSVQITDANNCTVNQSFTITEPAVLALNYTQTDVQCFGENTGAIDITVTGGTAPYTYAWSNATTSQDINTLAPGTYDVIVTDVNGCNISQSVTITQPTAALSVTESSANLTCFGANNGYIDLTVVGGTSPYTYAWNNGSTADDLFNLAVGTYEVTITDANGCSLNESYTITSPDELLVSGTSNDISCFAANDGTINLTTIGGVAPYYYTWSNGASTEDLVGLSPGNYSVQVLDANGCNASASFRIEEPTALNLSFTKVDISCFGGIDGSINLTVTGGTGTYTYAWSNGAVTEDLSGLTAGTYDVTVTDANGCQVLQTINLTQPASALEAVASIGNLTCFGANDGSIELLVTGGTGPYSYNWNTGSTAEDVFALAAGTYQVTIIDAKGCTIQQNYNVITPDPLNSSAIVQNVSCNGLSDASIDLTVTGGTLPYIFNWSNGATIEDLTDLAVGNYQVQISDANGCSTTRSFNITQPLPLSINYVANNVSCFEASDGNITTQVSGGTAPYTYSWSNGQSTKDLNGLTGGSFTLTVTDANGCSATQNIGITAPVSALSATDIISDAGCNGLPNGKIALTVTGGTAPFNYLWSNGSVQRDLVNVFAGNYEVTITDRNGCAFSASYTIAQPDAIVADFAITSTTCFGDADGSIVVNASGGTAPYSYIWSNGSTSKDLFNIAGGTYNLTITDANNCSTTSTVEVGDSRDLNVNIQKTDISCKGDSSGAILLEVTGGSGSYTYEWDNGSDTKVLSNLSAGVYRVLITDAGGCATTTSVIISEPSLPLGVQVNRTNEFACFGEKTGFARAIPSGGIAPYTYLWSNGARTQQIDNLGSGNYTVSVSDANGCIVQQNFTITQPQKPVTINSTGILQLSCAGQNDGSIELLVDGGTAPYAYLWSTGNTTNKIENLTAGEYTVRVVDAKGCITEKVFSVSEPLPLQIANAFVNESQCFDDRNGSIDLDVNGGTFPYTYQWSDGSTTKNLIGISAGTYTVEITDANGCRVQSSFNMASPERFVANPAISPISCVGANDASISLNIEGGITPVVIQWNTGSSAEVITDIGPGAYNVLITDKKGCTIQKTFNIIEPLPLKMDAYIEDAIACNNPQSGRINVIVSGGTAPFEYLWSNGARTPEITDVLPGTYVVTVTDKFGCEVQGTYSVDQPEPLRIGLSSKREIDCENRQAGVLVKAEVTGGFGNYTYNWSMGSSVNNENYLIESGRLNLIITDDRGCTQSKAIDISIPDFGEAEFSYNSASIRELGGLAANDPVNFYDESLGKIIDWKWEFGDGFDSDEIDPIHTYDSPGIYTVILVTTDEVGCTSSTTKVLEITEGYRIMLPDAFTPNDDSTNDYYRPAFLGLIEVQFSIFNTWGEVIFSTTDLETKGWNGYVKGLPAENGNYIYKISGVTENGLRVQRDGIFALIK
jgi:gliding motility-associated-like protein